ncbi:MAG: multiple sugar transport system permease protein [Thermomicrobiales bacterium]|jgi:multiple sugar transport system permease protein|nr:multiple sugar transport system permease protein [Thermomicrobiales bacterium]
MNDVRFADAGTVSFDRRGTVAVEKRRRGVVGLVLRRLGLAIVLAFFVLPIVYLVSVSLTPQAEILSGTILPNNLAWHNWPAAYEATTVSLFVRNSAIVAGLSALVTLLIAVPATYSMVRFGVGGRPLYSFILSSYVAPPIVALLPLFYLLRRLHGIDSLWGLALVHAVANVPVAVWLLDSFFRQVPRDIEEAAWVDGAGVVGALVRMVVPLIAPGIVAAGIICLILSYNEFLFAVVLTYRPETQTLPVGISLFQGDRLVNYGQMAAASLTGMAPVYLVALFFQRWLIRGLTHGAVK